MLNLLFVLPTQFPAREQKERNTDYNRERRVNQEKKEYLPISFLLAPVKSMKKMR